MSSTFKKQLCDRKQVTQDMIRVKEVDSTKKQVPEYFTDAPSDCKMAEVPVREDSPINDTTPISKSIIYGEDGVQSDCKKAAPSINVHSPRSEPTKSKALMDEEV
jgi:hypothetical protein